MKKSAIRRKLAREAAYWRIPELVPAPDDADQRIIIPGLMALGIIKVGDYVADFLDVLDAHENLGCWILN
jgi:hypothetical protein